MNTPDEAAAAVGVGVKSWVVWLRDGRYSYAWGETAEEAKQNYLDQWGEGIARIAPASEHPSQLPPAHYVPMVKRS